MLFTTIPGRSVGPLGDLAGGVDISPPPALVVAAVLLLTPLRLFPEPRAVHGPEGRAADAWRRGAGAADDRAGRAGRRGAVVRPVHYGAGMTDFVLVAGAWLGAWAWDEVAAELRSAGHDAHPLTLSGLAEKQGVPAGQRTHVEDIVEEVERLDLRDVVLVGHSYAGVPVGQAGVRLGGRVRRVVLVDANVAVDGETFLSGWPSDEVRAAIKEHGGFWPPLTAADCAGQGLTDEQIARFVGGSTPHPGATLTEPAVMPRPLSELPGTYVKCLLDGDEPWGAATELLQSDRWNLVDLDTGHWPMFSRPRELARILHESATAP